MAFVRVLGLALAAGAQDPSFLQTATIAELHGSYAAFLKEHGEDRFFDHSVDIKQRMEIFRQRRDEVRRLNSRPGASWKAAVNKFTDFTDQELRSLTGYVHGLDLMEAEGSFLNVGGAVGSHDHDLREEDFAANVDWLPNTTKSTSEAFFRDQGGCGSCWATSAVAAVEMYAEMQHGNVARLSTQQLIDCTPNPKQCGGTGGCQGATALLAQDYIVKNGILLESDYPSVVGGGEGTCQQHQGSRALNMESFTRVKRNSGLQLLQAAASGPVLVSVGASGWSMYRSGVWDDCERDITINHSVIIVGYGKDAETGYKFWKVRNSWGSDWGEDGYMRLLRHDMDSDQYCGDDHEPLKGFVCKGGPSVIKVCGMCGIQSNPSHPGKVTITKM